MSFRTYHLLHHSQLDEYDYDADLAFRWEARLVGNSPLRKAVWLFLFAAIEVVRPLRMKRRFADGWAVANTIVDRVDGSPDLEVRRRARPGLRHRLDLLRHRPAPARRALDPGALHLLRGPGDLLVLRRAQSHRVQHRLPQRAPRPGPRAVGPSAEGESDGAGVLRPSPRRTARGRACCCASSSIRSSISSPASRASAGCRAPTTAPPWPDLLWRAARGRRHGGLARIPARPVTATRSSP